MTVPNSASSSGSGRTRRRTRKSRESCAHPIWILDNTQYPIIKGSGQTNVGSTRGRCKLCGKKRGWEAATPDNVHGMESIIASNIRLEKGELPDGFQLEEEDYDA